MNDLSGTYSVYIHLFPNGKKYVGVTSQNPSRRWHGGHGYETCNLMKNAIKKYGWDNIKHDIVKTCVSRDEASRIERLLIAILRSDERKFGYNIAPGGYDGPNLNTSKIEYLWSQGYCIQDIVKESGHKSDTIKRALLNCGVSKQDIVDRGIVIGKDRAKKKALEKAAKTDASVASEWANGFSVLEISRHLGISFSTVSSSLSRQNVSKEQKRERSLLRRKELHFGNDSSVVGYRMCVDQFTMDGEYLRTFESIKQAADSVGVTPTAICGVCQHHYGQKTAAGYRWEYSKDQMPIRGDD